MVANERGGFDGFAIVVADRGWVWVGDVSMDASFCVISGARCIRRWGTSAGLGELAEHGPRPNTVLDAVGVVRVPARAVIALIDSEVALWSARS